MRFTLENIFLVISLVLTEAWFLSGYFSGKPDYEPAIAFLVALGAIFTKDRIKAKFGILGEPTSHDLALFNEFQHLLPVEPTLRLLKEKDFGDSFHRDAIQPLYDFVETWDSWDSVDKEFLNRRLEKERKALYEAARDLASEFVRRTVPVGDGDFISVLPDNQRGGPRPANVIEDARVLNAKTREFTSKYESFVRICKAALKS